MAGINPFAQYKQTAFTTQTGTVYKTNIDANNIVAERVVDIFACHAQATNNMTVLIEPGHMLGGVTLTEIGAQTTIALSNGSTSATLGNANGAANGQVVIAAAGVTNNATISGLSGLSVTLSTAATTTATVACTLCQVTGTIAAPAGNPRIDRVVVDRFTGVFSVITGTPGATPAAPAITSGKAPVAQILVQVASVAIDNTMITDERDAAAFGRGTGGEYNVGTSANNVLQLDGSAKIPAVDASQVTHISAANMNNSGVTSGSYNGMNATVNSAGLIVSATSGNLASSSTYGMCKVDGSSITAAGGVLTAANTIMTALGVGSIVFANPSSNVAAGGTIAGSGLTCQTPKIADGGSGTLAGELISVSSGDTLSGTWQALQTVTNQMSGCIGLFQRIA